jgi:sulfide:quinone oxidoreductase
LILAVGAGTRDAYVSALTFHDGDPVQLNGLLRDIEQGYVGSVALVVPPAGSWALPVYELALLLARYVRSVGEPLPIHLVTPEAAPLAIFGAEASAAVAALLAAAGITVHAGSFATIERSGRITLAPGERRLDVQRIVALPIIVGRPIVGVPADEHGFVPVDSHSRVVGVDGVYAVGDGANFPVKQGGLATQQADVAARDICADAGAPVEAEPLRPVLRGLLLTEAGADRPPAKIIGHYLGPWLGAQDPAPGGLLLEAELSPQARPLSCR